MSVDVLFMVLWWYFIAMYEVADRINKSTSW